MKFPMADAVRQPLLFLHETYAQICEMSPFT